MEADIERRCVKLLFISGPRNECPCEHLWPCFGHLPSLPPEAPKPGLQPPYGTPPFPWHRWIPRGLLLLDTSHMAPIIYFSSSGHVFLGQLLLGQQWCPRVGRVSLLPGALCRVPRDSPMLTTEHGWGEALCFTGFCEASLALRPPFL